MVRQKELHRFFWEQVAQALGLRAMTISEKGWGSSSWIVVNGHLSGFDVETGSGWEPGGQGGSVQYTFATVSVSGLPRGLSIDGQQLGFSTAESVSVDCDAERVRRVTLDSIPTEIGGLRVMQVSVDLEAFLTSKRRSAICSMRSDLTSIGGRHQLEQRKHGEPYLERRVLAAAMAGDAEAVQSMWRHRDQVVALVKSVLKDAETAARLLQISSEE